ncbi:hypothetical protein [Dictyobacter aurantiacus]|uniref:3-keto-disaccharide hydrolase domain-containing protein n=1 Tax=Dictyobacter aurantiacus TaxID=1936993 RepID=A0A401ZG91_9CHLR|nr:hypothetical protein [Dictyobacter aurantiacus]GCE05901.1 hypothetical protein KDAU_32300 [Dictyobacter aurantiacus]
MIAAKTLVSNWHVQEDTLVQTEFSYGERTILKGSPLERFEFGATMRLDEHKEGVVATLGILAQYSEQYKIFVHLLKQQEHWVLAVESTDIDPVINRVVALPETFDLAAWHTLRLIQEQEQIHIHLDGTHVLSINEPARTAQPGLIITNAAASFSHIWQIETNA